MEKTISNAIRQEIPSSGYKLESENGIPVLGRRQVCRRAWAGVLGQRKREKKIKTNTLSNPST